MRLSELEDYETRERSIARDFGPQAVTSGFVTDGARIYQDVALPKRLGFARSGSPLCALVLLYETTVLYFPPAGMRELEARFGMTWVDMLRLVECGSVMPIIGHPTHYARRAHFNELFDFSPPSVWARGDELARKFAGADGYWDVARAELSTSQMVDAPWIRRKFKRQFPKVSDRSLTERIEIELITNFVDLCIYGWEPIALSLARNPNHEYSARRILELSELLTYPTLMGMGGTPNYAFSSDIAISRLMAERQWPDRVRDVGDLARLLVDGLDLCFPKSIDTNLITQFHSDAMANRLWSALEALEDSLLDDDGQHTAGPEAAALAERRLLDTLLEVRRAGFGDGRQDADHRGHPWVDLTVKVGTAAGLTVATGALGIDWVAAAGLGAGVAGMLSSQTYDAATRRVEEAINERTMVRRRGALATQVWWLSDWRKRVAATDA